MAYTDDAVLSKLSALNESHDSIATTAQWIMFHRRHASQTVRLWLSKLKDLPSSKRLNMIYLANEVTQQSKARHKDDFLNAFAPFIADATAVAYKGAPADVQGKLRRVVEVWKDRSIFDKDILQDLEAKLAEIDRTRPAAKVGAFGGPAFSSSSGPPVPAELNPLLAPQLAVTKSLQPAKGALNIANTEYEKLSDPVSSSVPLPVQAARLNGLLKSLANAEGAVTECIRARRDLIRELEKILATNRDALSGEEKQMMSLSGRRTEIEQKKQAVELAILSGLPANTQEQAPTDRTSGSPVPEPERPQVEALTPPHVQDHGEDFNSNQSGVAAHQNGQQQPPAPFHEGHSQNPFTSSAPGIEMLSNLASQYQAVPLNGAKKRKIQTSDDFPDLGGDDGIDADVKEMLRKDSQGS
ncbi:hypothetical protein VTK26DRAFT_8603 [Humicola hyalothermophila]